MKILLESIKNSLLVKVFLLLIFFSGFSGCDDDIENPIPENIRAINQWILESMETYYLWADYIPSNTQPEHEPDPFEYFDKLLYKVEDRWSFLTDDYEALKNKFSGIEESFGYELGLFYIDEKTSQADPIVVIVEYITPTTPSSPPSPAELAGLKRGDIILSVDGTLLTDENYRDLLLSKSSYTLGFGSYVDGEFVLSGESVNLSAVVLQENPVFMYDIIEQGNHRIGYLVYNRFIRDLLGELETAITDLKNEGITDLILDLRYNPGGSISTATSLASMLGPAAVVNNQEIFVKYIWNSLLESYFIEEEGVNSENLILKFTPESINLDFTRLYVIMSANTASASELLINCLNPYMDITLIGTTTHGKYAGSITIRADEPIDTTWAIQPIVLKVANVNGETGYKDGFPPDYYTEDDLMAPLGNLEEDMLAQAVSLITGIPVDQLARKAVSEFPLSGKKLMSVTTHPVLDNSELIVDTESVLIP